MSYLKVVDNGLDDLAVRRIINVPRRGIGAATIEKINVYAVEHNVSFLDACFSSDSIDTLGNAKKKINGFADLIREFRRKMQEGSLEELFKYITDETGYIANLKAEETEEAEGRIENINELLNKVVTYEQEAEEASLSELLEEIALVADIDNLEDSDNRVVLMTLHSAKGLEFPVVYMTGMEEGLFPSYMSMNSGDPGDIEEERRLCYVGITRAMQQLTLTAAKQRMVHGNIQYSAISRFVKELPQEKLDWKEETFGGLFKKGPSMTANSLSGSLFGGSSSMSSGSSFSASQGSQTAKKTNYDNVFDLKYAKAFSSPKPDSLDYKEGDRVSHIKFGKGTVLAVEDMKKDYQVTVEFDTAGVKKLFAGFAKLKKI